MALTTAQYRAHIQTILVGAFPTGPISDELKEYLIPIVRRLVRYSRLGANEKEAAQRLAIEIAEQIYGHSPLTAGELHYLRFHLTHEAVAGSGGEL